MKYKLAQSEQQIENNAKKYIPVSGKKRINIETIISEISKKKSVTLRLNDNDLARIKSIAVDNGIPYQTLISSILHKYINHRFYEKEEVMKIVRLRK